MIARLAFAAAWLATWTVVLVLLMTIWRPPVPGPPRGFAVATSTEASR